jgi:hypothetical protein
LPISILATLKFTGILKEPQHPEIINIPSVSWNMTRPSDSIDFDEWVQNLYNDGKGPVSLSVNVVNYYPHNPGYPAYEHDYVRLRVKATTQIDGSFVYSVSIKFYSSDQYGFVSIEGDPESYELNACHINKMCDLLADELRAYVEASSVGRPENCSLSILAHWIFVEEDNIDHFISISLEVTYFNGSAYKKVGIPVNLWMLKDVGDNFESAKHIEKGFYRGCLDDADTVDMYIVSISGAMIIDITMTTCKPTADFNLFLYDASRTQVANSTNLGSTTEHIVHSTHASFGYWYIKVERAEPRGPDGNGIYNLTVNLSPTDGD